MASESNSGSRNIVKHFVTPVPNSPAASASDFASVLLQIVAQRNYELNTKKTLPWKNNNMINQLPLRKTQRNLIHL